MHTVITQVAVQEKSHVHCMPIYALLDLVFIFLERVKFLIEKPQIPPKCYDM